MNSEYPGLMNGREEEEVEAQLRELSKKLYGRDLLAYVGQLERMAWSVSTLLGDNSEAWATTYADLLVTYVDLPRVEQSLQLDSINDRHCRECGCTYDDACEYELAPGIHGVCSWATVDLCSRCADGKPALWEIREAAGQ